MIKKNKNDHVPVTIEDNILTFAYYRRSAQRLNLPLRVKQPAIDFFVLLLFGHCSIEMTAWGLLIVIWVERVVEVQKDSWLSKTRVNTKLHYVFQDLYLRTNLRFSLVI